MDAGCIFKVELIKDLLMNWIGSLRERKESVLTLKVFGLVGEWGALSEIGNVGTRVSIKS